MGGSTKQSKGQRVKGTQQPQPEQTGLLPVLAVTAAVAGFIWWRRHKQNASEAKKKAQERGSVFHFPKGKTEAAGNARGKVSTNNKKNKKERKAEIKARQQKNAETSKPSGSKEKNEKEKEPLILNYSYFKPERDDKMSAPAQRMTFPPKEQN